MAHSAVAIHWAAMTIMADDHTLTIDRGAAGTTRVGEAAATRVTVTIASLNGSRSYDGKAESDSQEGDEFFHVGWGLVLIFCRSMAAWSSDAALLREFEIHAFILMTTKCSSRRNDAPPRGGLLQANSVRGAMSGRFFES